MDFAKYIIEEGLIMIPTLYALGFFFKNTKKVEDWMIPFILLGISLVLTPFLLGGFTAMNIIQAILVVAAAVLANQLTKQFKEGVL